MSVSATDADDPVTENAALGFSIVGQESIPPNAVNKTMFGINNQTGAIYTRDVGLDREVNKTQRYWWIKGNTEFVHCAMRVPLRMSSTIFLLVCTSAIALLLNISKTTH